MTIPSMKTISATGWKLWSQHGESLRRLATQLRLPAGGGVATKRRTGWPFTWRWRRRQSGGESSWRKHESLSARLHQRFFGFHPWKQYKRQLCRKLRLAMTESRRRRRHLAGVSAYRSNRTAQPSAGFSENTKQAMKISANTTIFNQLAWPSSCNGFGCISTNK